MHQQSPPDPAADDDDDEPDDYDDEEEERERNSVQFTAICLSASPFQIFFFYFVLIFPHNPYNFILLYQL